LQKLKTYNNQHQKQIVNRAWALLLLVLFVNALIIQGFHHHHTEEPVSRQQNQSAKNHEGTQVHSAKISCKLCEVIKHQSHFYDLPAPIRPVVAIEESIELPCRYMPQHPVAYIHSAANKGPPSLMA
jgi:hypothetical protein